jgi:hypothetical protein
MKVAPTYPLWFDKPQTLVGAWRSLVARFHGVEEVAGSNLVAPTINFIRVSPWFVSVSLRPGSDQLQFLDRFQRCSEIWGNNGTYGFIWLC